MAWYYYVIIGIVSYLIGAFSFARLISRKFLKDDVTKHGSGNPGTTNMYRSYGLKIGIINLILDVLKGVIPVLICLLVFGYEQAFIAGTCAILGHIFPVYYGFKGGKGVATTLGVFAVVSPIPLAIVFVVMFLLIYFFEYMAPVSLLGIAVLVCVNAINFKGNIIICVCVFVIFVLTWFAHRSNIVRMLQGKENRVILRKSRKTAKNAVKTEQESNFRK